MPKVYNGNQSQLEYYAINGNVATNGGLGRLALINQSSVGKGKYTYKGPYRNPDITGNISDEYSATHTNALADSDSPYNGKGTGDGISNGVFGAINNYNGGSLEDINGVSSYAGSGRNQELSLNVSTWGYGPSAVAGSNYTAPNTSANKGQVTI